MKKIFFVLILLLTCCAPGPAAMPPTPVWENSHSAPTADWSGYQPNIEAFQFGEKCPHLCWLGVNPGTSTAEETHTILSASDQINPKMEVTDTGIVAKWHTDKAKKLEASVYVRFENGIVKSIAFTDMAPFTIKDFIALAGEPDGVNIDMNIYGDVMEMPYGAYYFSRDILIGSESADTGLNPNDPVTNLILNVPYNKEIFRAWVGYGHLTEYFKGKEVHQHPTNP